ncbi:MAG TPA: polyphenol oxidase family protein [Solirubrobacterales bacterium]|nr:polyphenol oxidase family protein [Solirubrobacterales bacterium]
MEWREGGGLRWLEAAMPGATAAFTTRLGGVSEAPFDALNLGILTDDAREAVTTNRKRLAKALGFAPDRIAVAHQVHGAELVTHPDPRSLPCSFASYDPDSKHREPRRDAMPKADGHVIADDGVAALVFVADCVPVALSGPGGVAMLHCGWRGLAAGIVAKGAAAIGATDAAIGPSIGPCCYEVGPEVLTALQPPPGPKAAQRTIDRPLGGGADLKEVARERLRAAGVERIEASDLCTSCETELFFSHRRDRGRTGRQAGLVWRGEGGS